MGRYWVCYLVVIHALTLTSKKALKATIHSPAFSSVAHNSRVSLSIQDIEDEMFWKAQALNYCDANYPAMDKTYFPAHRANDAILKSALDFDNNNVGL